MICIYLPNNVREQSAVTADSGLKWLQCYDNGGVVIREFTLKVLGLELRVKRSELMYYNYTYRFDL